MLGSLDGGAGIASKRLWAIEHRLFATTADALADTNPALAKKLRRATPHQPACAIRPGANASELTSSPAGHGVPAISDSLTAAMAGAVCRP